MRITLLIFITIFLAAKCQMASLQCTSDTFLSSSGRCECLQQGKYSQPVSPSLLDETLFVLNNSYSAITKQIPLLYSFSEGESSSYILNGGNDMYDGGNYISVSPSLLPSLNVTYSKGKITKSENLTTSNFTYYTVKYPGLFVLTADTNNIDEFSITGDLGADGLGEVDGVTLSKIINGTSYKGFVKRVYGTTKPTVNHLIIIEDNGAANHSYSEDTNNDLHVVRGLRGVNRLYYLLFATNNASAETNVRVDDATMDIIMTTFIATVNSTSTKNKCSGDCPKGCLTCMSATECLKCEAPLELTNGICQHKPCTPGSFLNSQGQCQCEAPGKFFELVERPTLGDTLSVIKRDSKLLTNQIPSIHNFTEGEAGNYIYDGTYDMYDSGNYLSTDLASPTYSRLNYSNQIISQNAMLGTNGSYYTAKFPGLFLFAADINISNFSISGELGTDGMGQVEATILNMTVNGVTYKGFVKRVFGTSDASVNHLVIIQDNGLANHTYSTNTNNDSHIITDLDGVDRLYYLLFSSYNSGSRMGLQINDTVMETLMASFISILNSVQECTGDCPVNCLNCISATECIQCNAISELIDGRCQPLSCETGSFLNNRGECQCIAPGQFLESVGPQDLSETLKILNDNFNLVTGEIPSVFYFTEGTGGNYISDGSQDMYDGGNYIYTNLIEEEGSYLYYSNKVIRHDSAFGEGGRYFTAKYSGLFALAADIDNLTSFATVGWLGTGGLGQVDGLVLTQTIKGVTYKGFVKRVFGTDGPTVNHLIIVQDNGQANHYYPNDTNDDKHVVRDLQGVNRLYYLLFSSYEAQSQANDKIDDAAIQAIMTSFLSLVSTERECTGNCPAACVTCISATVCRECKASWTLVEGTCYPNM